ncbi:hypothetical protein [Pseudomonas sp. ESBL1]|uniref:hypothetical protein n=1 Tax=Pseudomonas sp. ESBL1 TaxID=3077324 RepID=UPI002FC85DB3
MFSTKIISAFTASRLFSTSVLLWLLTAPLDGQTAEVTVSARYKGNVTGAFENTTPQASFCSIWVGVCKDFQAFTVSLPLTYDKVSTHQAANPREQFYIKLPARRTVQVVHEKGIDTHQLVFEITHSSQKIQGDTNFSNTANPVFTAYPQGGCSYLRTYLTAHRAYYLWATRLPESPSPCYSSGQGGQPKEVYFTPVSDMGIGYRLTMPSALRMKQGLYRGSASFTVGPGGDFDLGDGVSNLNSPTLTINFELDVQHAFVLNFPAASDRAVLEPPGGWSRWLGGGTPPSRLERSLRLNLWSTGPFKVYKTCQYDQGMSCGIRNGAGHQVPVDVALTLPSSVQHANAPVQRLTIPTGRASALAFDMAMPVAGQSGQLHFDVVSQHVKSMLDYPGSVYQGDVTVLFDATL